ncbi:MAG: hypothetical protein ACYDCM_10025 [Candidatus Acidiferrales bacterium]
MKTRNSVSDDRFPPALEAIGNLLEKELNEILYGGWSDGLSAHFDIDLAPLNDKSARFYRHFVPLRQNLVSVLSENYRRYFKLSLAHPHQAERDPHEWALAQLQPAILAVAEWIRGWYILACDGAQPIASTEFVPGQTVSLPIPTTVSPAPPPESWRAPAWLFQVSLAYFGIGALKTEHVPATNSDQKLSPAHTRLLLKGARRVFLWELGVAIENVRNEEVAAAGAIPAPNTGIEQTAKSKKQMYWLKGFEGLGPKVANLSYYTHALTEKQQMAFSLKNEYQLKPAEVASRMGIDRSTMYEHLDAANKKINEAYSNERRKARLAKNSPD